jgi:biotin carboxyl carrier protein
VKSLSLCSEVRVAPLANLNVGYGSVHVYRLCSFRGMERNHTPVSRLPYIRLRETPVVGDFLTIHRSDSLQASCSPATVRPGESCCSRCDNLPAQARKQQNAAEGAVDTTDAATANVRAAASALGNARRALSDTEVRAPHNGRIVGLHVSTGEVVAPSQSLFTLINTEEWFASANFREAHLQRIGIGECVTVYSMIDRRQPINGIVDSVGYGFLAADRSTFPELLLM